MFLTGNGFLREIVSGSQSYHLKCVETNAELNEGIWEIDTSKGQNGYGEIPNLSCTSGGNEPEYTETIEVRCE